MAIKIVSIFLILMLVLAMFGKLRVPSVRGGKDKQKRMSARKCPECGSYILGKGECACGHRP